MNETIHRIVIFNKIEELKNAKGTKKDNQLLFG
jgi:hypothetical protein